MRILQLTAENFARLKAVTIRPDGSLVQITGANGEGKSSCLGAIWACLKGRAAAPPVPIRTGAEEAKIRIDLGRDRVELTATRIFRTDKHGELTTSLSVVADGKKVTTKPQALLDAVLGEFAIDPLEFARLPAKEQFDRVKSLVPGVDFDVLADERQRLYESRTHANRRAEEQRIQAEQISGKLPPGPAPKAVDVAAKIDEMQRAGELNTKVANAAAEISRLNAEAERKLDEAEQLRARAASIENQAAGILDEIKKLPTPPKPIDVAVLREQIAGAQAVNTLRAQHDKATAHREDQSKAETESRALSQAIDDLDREKREAIAAAKLPVDGLSFGDGIVLLNGLPFSQAAMSKKIKTSAQLVIALNDKPEALRLMTIDEGSELDHHSLAELEKLAEEHDFQIILTRVDETGAVGFVLEDGSIKDVTL